MRKLRERSPSLRLEDDEAKLTDAIENLSQKGLVKLTEESLDLRFSEADKERLFGKTKGLHASYDEVIRYDFRLELKRLNIRVETLTDFNTGRSIRFDMSDIGPQKSGFTWQTIAGLTQLHLGYFLPANRMAGFFDISEFSDVAIYRMMESNALMSLPIYMELGYALADADYLQYDDTKPLVLEMKRMIESGFTLEIEQSKLEIIEMVGDEFGRFSQKADGKGLQKQVNLTCIAGRINEEDPLSDIYFYHTHYGHAGNVLEKLLELRSPAKKSISLQGDLAVWNKPPKKLAALFEIEFYGCLAHARRPYHINKDDDDSLCDQMLFLFLLLTKMESRIDQRGRTEKRVLYYRRRYGRKIWSKIHAVAQSVRLAKLKNECKNHHVWPPSTKFGQAANYIVKHFGALTNYLNNARISPTNNKMERLLRPEKLFLANSKYKGTEWARLCMDINRTIAMTCIAANVPYEEYLKIIYKNRDKLESNSGDYTPYAISISKRNESINSAAGPPIKPLH